MPRANARRRARRVFAVLLGCSALAIAIPIHASTPDHPDLWAPGDAGKPAGAQSSASWTGPALAGNPDPLGPPAPSCTPYPSTCDRTTFTLHASTGYTTSNIISLTATISDSNAGTSFDIAILDGGNNVLAQSVGVTGTGTATATDVQPGTYVVEVDADIGTDTPTGSYSGTLDVSNGPRTPQPSHASNGGITGSRETVADPYRLGTEPTIAVSPDGTVYEGPIFGFSTTQSFIMRSDDGGKTFNTLGLQLPQTSNGKPTTCPGGGDEDLSTDASNNLYFFDLGGAPVVPAAVSPDHGNTFVDNCLANDTATNPGKPNSFPDRQWLTTDIKHNIEWYIWRDGLVSASTPTDPVAGPVYGEFMEHAPLPSPVPSPAGASQLVFTHLCTNGTGQGIPCITDLNVAGNAVTDNTSSSPFYGNTYLAINRGAGVSVVRINPDLTPSVAEFTVAPGKSNVLFPTVAVDRAGNVYETYTDAGTYQLMFSWSHDGGASWTTPVAINGAPAAVTAMPWIVAGDSGRVDIVFYGSSDTHAPTINSGPWDVYMLQSLHADNATPSFSDWTQALMTDRPNHIEPICLSGLGCTTNTGPGGDRELGDFFRVALDSGGRAVVSFADGNNQLGQEVAGGPAAAPSFADYLRQATGPSLYGTGSVSPIDLPTNSVTVGPHNDPIPFAGPACPTACMDADALNLLSSSTSIGPGPDGTDVHVQLSIKNFTAAGTVTPPAGPNSTFLTRWWFNGKIYFVAAEFNLPSAGGAPTVRYFGGQVAPVSDGAAIKYAYYPASGAASGTPTFSPNSSTPGTLDLYIPPSAVGNPTPNDVLYSVTSYSNSHALPTAPTPPTASNFTDLPEIVDVLPAYNVMPTVGTPTPIAPWTPALVLVGVAAIAAGLIRRPSRFRERAED